MSAVLDEPVISLSNDLSDVVDDLARVQAAIAELEKEEKALKKELIESFQKEVVGTQHKAVISYVQPAPSVDFKAVCVALKISQSVLDQFKKTSAPYSRVVLFGL